MLRKKFKQKQAKFKNNSHKYLGVALCDKKKIIIPQVL
jgi:hypothetical protein